MRVPPSIKRISQKHAAEKHDFGYQKDPHAKRARFTLLLHVFEMVLQRWVAYFVFCVALSQQSVSPKTDLPNILRSRVGTCANWADKSDLKTITALISVSHLQRTLFAKAPDRFHLFNGRELVCLPGYYRGLFKVFRWWRRLRAPFQPRQMPGIGPGDGTITHRPDQINEWD